MVSKLLSFMEIDSLQKILNCAESSRYFDYQSLSVFNFSSPPKLQGG